MKTQSLAVFLLCLVYVYAETDITLLNCPAQYSVAAANTTYGSMSIQNFMYLGFDSQSNKETVQTIVITGDMDLKDQYLKQLAYPYIPFFILSAGIFITLVLCCLFDKSCPPCQSLRRDYIQDPYTKSELKRVFIPTMIFPIIIIAITFYMFLIIPNLKVQIDYTKCSIFSMLDTALNGDTANSWGGFTQLRNKVGNISSFLNSASTQIGTYLPGDDWLVDDMTIMKKSNLDIYKDYKDAQLITSDPTATASVVVGDPLPNIDSVFIKTGMGPNGTINTMVDDIDKGIRTTQILSEQAYKIDLAAKQLVQSSSTIQANAVSAINTLQMYSNQLNNSISYMDTFSTQMFDDGFSSILYLLQATMGFLLASSFLIIVGAISAYCFELLQCRNIVHLGWALYGIVHILVIMLIYLFLSGGSVGYHACNYINLMLTQQSQFLRLGDYNSNNILNRMQTCFFSDGDALKSFDISKQMETVTDFFANIVTYYDYQNSISKNYIDTSISTGKISGWIAAINNYKNGIYIDSVSSETADSNPNYALSRLNLYTLGGGSYPTCSQDRWVYDSTNCTDSSELIYTPTASDNDGLTLTTTQITCISFNSKLSTIQPAIWSQSDFRRRYIQIRQDCPDAYNQIIKYGQSIINFRDSRINLFQGIQDSLTDLLSQNTNFNTLLINFRSRVDQLYSSVSNLNNLITNEVDGLLVTSDCTILRDDLMVTYNTFCVNFMSDIATMGLCALGIGVLMIGGICSASIFGVKIAGYQRDKRIGVVQEESSLNSAQFVKNKQQNSSQQNSQDEKQQ